MARTVDEAREALLAVLPYMRYAITMANSEGTAKLGILCEFPDGGGKVEARFEADFLEDLALVIGAPDQTEEDELKASARRFLDKFGVGNGPE